MVFAEFHGFADTYNARLQRAAPLSDFSQVSKETTACVADVKVWMNKYKLRLYDEKKNELLAIGDCIRLSLVRKEPLTFGSSSVPF